MELSTEPRGCLQKERETFTCDNCTTQSKIVLVQCMVGMLLKAMYGHSPYKQDDEK